MDFIEVKFLILNMDDCRCLKEDSDNEVNNLISWLDEIYNLHCMMYFRVTFNIRISN